jgi:thiamine biosynthesis lipoprotein
MTSFSPSNEVERARPLLGTTVSIRVTGMTEAIAHAAITEAFAAVERIHALMSFHEAGSDLSRLHAAAPGARVQLDAQTAHVLTEARRLSQLTHGVFDVTIGSRLVAKGLLPAPAAHHPPHPDANWEDIEIDEHGGARLRRAAWIDLGGIAKGYAVDCAIDVLRSHGVVHGCVNAGGDLRTLGDGPHRVAIATDEVDFTHIPVLEVGETAIATSSGRSCATADVAPHIHGRTRAEVSHRQVATVVAPHCIHADALTKVVLALGSESAPVLQQFDAVAYLQNQAGQWTGIGTSV